MSWHYSQVLVEEFWEENCLDGEQSVQSNKTPTASAYCSKDKMTRFSRLSRYGVTFAPLTESRGEELLTWFQEGFHVRTSPQQEKEQELKVQDQDSGQKWRGSLAKYDPSMHSLKTVQCSLLEDSTQFSVTLPKWGLMQNGDVFQQPKSEQITKGIESGLSQKTWPTPDANMAARGTQENWTKTRPSGHQAQYTINQAVRDSLKMWPTPSSRDHKGGYQGGRIRNGKVSRDTLDVTVQFTDNKEKTGGQLNPTWVEWLMGWPLGWTDLKPLGMDKFQKWLELHGRY